MKKTQLTYKEKIKAIKNLRLFTNTSADWKNRYGNPDNEQECELLYKSLQNMANQSYSINLDELIEQYQKSSKNETFSKIKRAKIWKPEIIAAFIQEMLQPDKYFNMYPAEKLVGKKYLDALCDADYALLLGWVHKKFPFFDETLGDITTEANKKDIRFFKTLLDKFYPKEMENTNSPLMDMLFKELNGSNEVLRIDVYRFILHILDNIVVLTDKESMHELYHNAEWLDIPDIHDKDGIVWYDHNNMEYWTFSHRNGNNYLIRYLIQNKKYMVYLATLMADSLDPCKLYILNYNYIEFICSHAKIPQLENYAYYHVEWEADKMEVKHLTGYLRVIPDKLSKMKLTPEIKSKLDACVNMHPEFDFIQRRVQTLISDDYLFVECSTKALNADLQVIDSWYRIPKISTEGDFFSEINLNDVVYLLTWKDKSYLFFNTLELCIDLSDKQQLAMYQITTVPYPTIFTTQKDEGMLVKGGEIIRNKDGNVSIKSVAVVWNEDEKATRYNIIESFENQLNEQDELVEFNWLHKIRLNKKK